jgi:hypothetical protein
MLKYISIKTFMNDSLNKCNVKQLIPLVAEVLPIRVDASELQQPIVRGDSRVLSIDI